MNYQVENCRSMREFAVNSLMWRLWSFLLACWSAQGEFDESDFRCSRSIGAGRYTV